MSLDDWYPVNPTISHFVFVPGGEELCLIESSGRARIFSLITVSSRCVRLLCAITQCSYIAKQTRQSSTTSPCGGCVGHS